MAEVKKKADDSKPSIEDYGSLVMNCVSLDFEDTHMRHTEQGKSEDTRTLLEKRVDDTNKREKR